MGLEGADAFLLIGTNPRLESPVLNARIRKAVSLNDAPVALIGEAAELSYKYQHLGEGGAAFAEVTGWGHRFAEVMRGAKRPAVIVGAGALARPDGGAVARAAAQAALAFNVVREGWNGWNVLHTAAGRVGGLDLGFLPRAGGMDARAMLSGRGALDVLFLMGADEFDPRAIVSNTFVIYMGTHGDAGASRADVILPSAAYTEKPGTWVNTEGRVQIAARAVFPKGEAREDWAILRALSERLGITLPYDSIGALREKMIADHPTFGQVDYVAPGASLDLSLIGGDGEIGPEPLRTPIRDFYMTNPVARASVTMAECSAARVRPPVLMAAE
jgi:NADH-quinone oxidoreductase subunit G